MWCPLWHEKELVQMYNFWESLSCLVTFFYCKGRDNSMEDGLRKKWHMYNRILLLWRFSGIYPISIKKYHISKSGTDSPGSRRQGSEYCNSITNNKHIPRLKDNPNCIESYKWEYSNVKVFSVFWAKWHFGPYMFFLLLL